LEPKRLYLGEETLLPVHQRETKHFRGMLFAKPNNFQLTLSSCLKQQKEPSGCSPILEITNKRCKKRRYRCKFSQEPKNRDAASKVLEQQSFPNVPNIPFNFSKIKQQALL